MSDQNQKLSDQTKNASDILSTRKKSRQKLNIRPDYASDRPLIEDVRPNVWEKKINSW